MDTLHKIPPNTKIIFYVICCSWNDLFTFFSFNSLLLDFSIIMYVLIDFSSSSSSSIICINFHAFCRDEGYMVVKKCNI